MDKLFSFLQRVGKIPFLIRRNMYLWCTRKPGISIEPGNDITLDLVYVCHIKDAPVFLKSLQGSIDNVVQKINRLYVIYPESQRNAFKEVLKDVDYTEITDEFLLSTYLSPRTIDQINMQPYWPNWIKQQLLKYLVSYVVEGTHYLVIDSDTVIVDKMSFWEDGGPVFYFSDELKYRYRKYIKKLTGRNFMGLRSFISHMAIFNKTHVHSLLDYVGQKNLAAGFSVDDVINYMVKQVDFENNCVISEYELYYFYISRILETKHTERYWRNKNFSDLGKKEMSYAERYYTISFHHYDLDPSIYTSAKNFV